MKVPPKFRGEVGVVLGTGPSLKEVIPYLIAKRREGRCRLFGINNTFRDFPQLDVWIACDPAWHDHYKGVWIKDCDQWHWDEGIAWKYGYNWVEGRWGPKGQHGHNGLSTDPAYIHLNHSSGAQALNLAVHYGCDPILLVGYDMDYRPGVPRHYFDDLSADAGEYPEPLRKFSKFDKGPGDGLLYDYKAISEQMYEQLGACRYLGVKPNFPLIVNCTLESAMDWFPKTPLSHFL